MLFRRVRPRCRRAVKSQAMFWIIVTLVFLNSMVTPFLSLISSILQVLSTEHHGQPDWLSEFQEATNFFFVVLFTFEMLFKMYALGLSFYFIPLFNRFDFFVVITSILEMSLTMTNIIPPLGMSVLRCIRLLRAFKVLFSLDSHIKITRNTRTPEEAVWRCIWCIPGEMQARKLGVPGCSVV